MIRFLQNHLLLKSCIALFCILFFVFSAYLFVNSKYYSEFYTAQIDEKIRDRIEYVTSETNHHSDSMQHKAADLAQMGEMFYRMRTTSTTTVMEEEIFRYLIESFVDFPHAIGGGLWYEPWVFASDKQYFGPYVYRQNGEMIATWDLNTPEYDYHTQGWYTLAIPPDWNRNIERKEPFEWTPPYRDEAGSLSEMITVDAFMHDDKGTIIGISTVDWSLEWLQEFLAENRIFANSHALLVDKNSKIIIANTSNPESVMEDVATIPWFSSLEEPNRSIQQKNLFVEGRDVQVYYTLTDANMIYSIIIPEDEITASVTALQKVNVGLLLFLGLSLFVLMTWILVSILKPIVALTEVVKKVSDGDFDTRIKVKSKDEIGVLGSAFNTMADKIKEFQTSLKKKVDEKTTELFSVLKALKTKNTDLERSQLATINLLEDLEEEKKNIENKIIERTNELQLEKNKLLQVTSHMRGGGVLFDISHRVIFVNTELYKLLNIEPVEYDHVLESISAYFGETAIKEHLDRCFNGESFHVKEISAGGRSYEIYFHYFAHTTEQHTEIPSFFMLIFDITDFKLLEHSKSELISVASHQLRTPLTAMRGNVEMLIDESFGGLNKEQHELLNDIEDSTLRLITMVNDMLDITKIERNDFEMNRSKINVHHLLSSVIGDLTTYANQHEVTIDSEHVARDIIIEGDEVRLRQVFQNLIDNAIKYGKNKGKIRVAAEPIDGAVEITFQDDGIGIPKNEHSKIFARFYRATNTAKSTSSGSGLGLYIVRAIIQQHGGDITFESAEGTGTKFIVRLPYRVHTIYRKK